VREGAILIVPVKVPGAGIYIADVHAMQGGRMKSLGTPATLVPKLPWRLKLSRVLNWMVLFSCLTRMSELLNMPLDEVKNRATIVGSIMISRLPGMVQVTANGTAIQVGSPGHSTPL